MHRTPKAAPRRRGFRLATTPEPLAPKAPAPVNGHDGTHDTIAPDLLRGAAAIASYLGWSMNATWHALSAGNIPATKCGQQYITSKPKLRRHFGIDEAREG